MGGTVDADGTETENRDADSANFVFSKTRRHGHCLTLKWWRRGIASLLRNNGGVTGCNVSMRHWLKRGLIEAGTGCPGVLCSFGLAKSDCSVLQGVSRERFNGG